MKRKRNRVIVIPFNHYPTIFVHIFPDTRNPLAGRSKYELSVKKAEEKLREVRYRIDWRHAVEWKQTKWIDTGHGLVKFCTEMKYYRGVGPWHTITWEMMESGANIDREGETR